MWGDLVAGALNLQPEDSSRGGNMIIRLFQSFRYCADHLLRIRERQRLTSAIRLPFCSAPQVEEKFEIADPMPDLGFPHKPETENKDG